MQNVFSSEILNSFTIINKYVYKLAKMDAEKYGLTVVQLKALYNISYHPNIGLVKLAENLKLTNSTVSGVVDRLVQHGFVERHTPSHDRRAVTIMLSKKGEGKLEEIINNDSVLVKKLNEIKQLPEEDIEHLLRIHKQIQDILNF